MPKIPRLKESEMKVEKPYPILCAGWTDKALILFCMMGDDETPFAWITVDAIPECIEEVRTQVHALKNVPDECVIVVRKECDEVAFYRVKLPGKRKCMKGGKKR